MPRKTKSVKRGRTNPIRESIQRALADAGLRNDALQLVEQLALYWITEGTSGDEPGAAKGAYERLARHGYTLNSTRTLLYRPDGSEVVR